MYILTEIVATNAQVAYIVRQVNRFFFFLFGKVQKMHDSTLRPQIVDRYDYDRHMLVLDSLPELQGGLSKVITCHDVDTLGSNRYYTIWGLAK